MIDNYDIRDVCDCHDLWMMLVLRYRLVKLGIVQVLVNVTKLNLNFVQGSQPMELLSYGLSRLV